MKTAKSTSSSQNNETNEDLVFFFWYSVSNEVLRQVLQTLIASQIINLSCIIRVMIMITITIGVYNTINDTMLKNDIEPYIANAQSVSVIAVISFFLVPLHIMQFWFLITIVLNLSIILWSLAILVLLIRSDSLFYNLCWSGVKKGKALNKDCHICTMQVCDPECHCNHEKNLH